MSVEQSLRSGGVQVIAIANPPVNALSQAVRQGLVEAVTAAQEVNAANQRPTKAGADADADPLEAQAGTSPRST